ncbi:hypothetical protein GIB67_007382 [Kingdonia uniflora]|uniref:ZF-HD dimerization-type domain-containing protein n=1 Tax=Kingdonia uniflora TaxID=39325 RepID=A0A7J7NXD7_9MAGN|nr:hypothetical protein GIB67_007382 [Kingdonia uniflora]
MAKRGDEKTRRRNSTTGTVRTVRYGECLKNQAAHIGGMAVDGCNEFMASVGERKGIELECAACHCDQSFHRRIVEYEVVSECSSSPSNGK